MISPQMAHKVGGGGTDFHYSDHDILDLLLQFKEALPFLIPQTTEELKVELEQQKTETEKINLDNTKVIASQQVKIDELISQYKKLIDKMEFLYPKRVDRLVLDEKGKVHDLYKEYNKTVDEYIENETNWGRRKQESEKEGSPDKGKKFYTQVKTQTEEEFIKEALAAVPKKKKEKS